MKKSQIALIILVAAVMGVMVINYTSLSTSETFTSALDNPGTEFKITGMLDKTQEVRYDPEMNADQTVFSMMDSEGKSETVYLAEAKPQGLEQSESIDLYGSYVDGEFHASKMLMKCPSKYNDEKHALDGTAQNMSN
jgi:cytochrome c-type biogenesis protein CcmE